jgi:uncharacterized protein YggE
MTRILLAILLAMPALASVNSTAIAQGPKTIDVTGHGDSSAKPDMMTLSFTVTARSDSADECTRKESETSRQVIDALKATLGDSAKITTSEFSFSPSIEYGNATATPVAMGASELPAEEPQASWQFKADLNVYTETMDPLSDLIETGLAAGATSVSQGGRGQMPDEPDESPPVAAGSATTRYSNSSGEYRPRPPVYFVGLSVVSQGISPADSVRKGTALVNRVEAALKKQMGTQGKVIVSDFSVDQINPQQRVGIPQYQPPPQSQHKVYDAQVTVSAETPKLELLGPSVEVAMKAGAMRLNQVSFSLKDDSAARKEAIEKASADAKSKAETLANSIGVKLKGVLRITTNAQMSPYIVYGNQYMSAAAMHRESASIAAPMPVTPRDVGFGADVNVTYQIE